MVDFKFQLNRQGIRGQRGEKGDTGFSPLITEKINTKEEYVLHIQNETDDTSFDTPNLKEGLVPEDMGGTYVRLNRETGNQYYGDIDSATEIVAGVVKLEPEETVLNPTSETSVLTAQSAVNNYGLKTDVQKLQENIYVSAVGVQDSLLRVGYSKNGVFDHASLIELPSGSGDVSSAGNNRFTGDNTFTGKVNIASLRSDDIQTTENKKYLTELDVDNQTIKVVNGKLHANLDELDNEVNSLTGEVTDLSGRVTTNEADIATMKTSLSMKQTKLTAGTNITLTDLTNGTVRIDATGGGGTGDIPIATTTTAGKVKPDGTTITITDDGTISAVGGGGSAPANMMTTDTDQTIRGFKEFIANDDTTTSSLHPALKAGGLLIGTSTNINRSPSMYVNDELILYTASGKILQATNDSAANYLNVGDAFSPKGYTYLNLYGNTSVIKTGSENWNGKLELHPNHLTYTDSKGTVTDLLAGNIPTVIDGGDSATV